MLRFLILTLSLFLVSFSAIAQPQHWLAKKGELEFMIIGSVHVGDKSMYPLPKSMTRYLSLSRGLIIEADVSNPTDVIYPPTKTLSKEVLNKHQRRRLVEIAKSLGLPETGLLNAPPWLTALRIQRALVNKLGYQSEEGVDMHLIQAAKAKRIPVIPLESVQFQIDLITGQAEGGKEMLVSSIEEYDAGDASVQCLIESWKSGDSRMLLQASLTEQATETFNQAFLYDRNRDWAQKLDSASVLPHPSGHYTVVVGSLHLVGKDNLIQLLEKRGFEIKALAKTRPAQCDI